MGWRAIEAQLRDLDGLEIDVGVHGGSYRDWRPVALVAAIQEHRTRWMSRASEQHDLASGQVADAAHRGRDARAVAALDAEALADELRAAAPADSGRLRRSIAAKVGR